MAKRLTYNKRLKCCLIETESELPLTIKIIKSINTFIVVFIFIVVSIVLIFKRGQTYDS